MQCLSKLFLVLAQLLIRAFPKSLYLKRSTKGAMNSSFPRALCTKASNSQKLAEIQCFRKLFQLLAKCITFPNQVSTKGAINSSFRRASFTQPSINKNLTEIQCLNKLLQVLAKSLIKTFPKQLFTSALRKEQRSAPFVEHPVHSLLSAESEQK